MADMTGTSPARTPKRRFGFSLRLRERLAAIAPEHFGDLFTVLLVAALALGAAGFWFAAWLPSRAPTVPDTKEGIPSFSDEELESIVAILHARTEASTAPVVPPSRDPFQ